MLVLSFFVMFVFVFALGIYFGKLKVNIERLDFEMNGKIKSKNDYEINVGVYLFGILRILGFTIEEDGVKVLGKKILYKNLKKGKTYRNIINRDISNFDKKLITGNIKKLDIKFDKVNLNLKLGSDSTLITSFLTFIVSTFVSFIIQKSVTKYNPNKHKFIITPMYENRNVIRIFLELVISLKIKNVVKVLNELNNLSKTEHIKHKIKFKEIKI